MWEAIGQAIKVFVEKHLIPTVISVVVAIISFLVLPTDFWMITKIGKVPFALLVAGIVFLLIQFIIYCCNKIAKWLSNRKSSKYYGQNAIEDERKTLDELWSAIDAFNPDDKKTIKEFLQSNNAPIEKSSGARYFGNSLFNSNWVVSTEEYGEEKTVIHIPKELKGKAIPVNPSIFDGGREIIVKYKLRDEIFNALKYSMDKYGKISHFE